MSGITMFNAAVCVTMTLAMAYLYKTQISTKTFKQARTGICLFGFGLMGIVNAVDVVAEPKYKKGRWFAYTEVYGGLESTFKQSPQCQNGSSSNRLTSNGGIRQNVYESYDRNFSLNLKYTHHSCAFNRDRNGYDALGFELNYRFNWR